MSAHPKKPKRIAYCPFEKKSLFHLSGGEKQMVYLARGMVQEARVMVLDDPTAYLDFKR